MVRHKNRYLLVKISEVNRHDQSPLHIRSSTLYHSLLNIIQTLYGDYGVAAVTSGLVAKYCNEKTRIAIIRCRHGPHRFVASSVPCVKSIEHKKVQLETLYCGATIRQCFKVIKRYQQRKFDEFCVGLKSEQAKEILRKEIMNLDPMLTIQ